MTTNQAPTTVVLTPLETSVSETADTSSVIVVATIAVTDDGLGTNDLSLSGDDGDRPAKALWRRNVVARYAGAAA